MHRSEDVLGPIRTYVQAHVWRTSRGLPRIEKAHLGSRAALLGGEALFTSVQLPSTLERGRPVHV